MKKVFLSICCMSLLAISLISVSCNKDSKDSDNGSGGSFVITAKNVIGDDDEIANVEAFVANYNGNIYKIASDQYKNNGFQLTLPATVPNESLWSMYELGCIDDLVNHTNAQTTIMGMLAFDGEGARIGSFWLADFESGVLVSYLYADRNFSVKGYDCDDWKWDCTFKKGWNEVYYNHELTTTQKPSGTNLQWCFMELGSGDYLKTNPLLSYHKKMFTFAPVK
ncbi:MAG: hypothetical protein FWF09_03450 [Bacteroidales bacterium]|nr:hypothetical protein [Bacteroidales bacterium]